MNNCVPKKCICGEFCYITFKKKKTAAEAHRILEETYSDYSLSETTCRDWFGCFKNNDFDIEERFGAPKKFEDEEYRYYSKKIQVKRLHNLQNH